MSNRGINEELLEDIKSIVIEERDMKWKEFSEELPEKEDGRHILVYVIKTEEKQVLRYYETYDEWCRIFHSQMGSKTIWFRPDILVNNFDLWKPVDMRGPSKEFCKKIESKIDKNLNKNQ